MPPNPAPTTMASTSLAACPPSAASPMTPCLSALVTLQAPHRPDQRVLQLGKGRFDEGVHGQATERSHDPARDADPRVELDRGDRVRYGQFETWVEDPVVDGVTPDTA